MAWVESKRLQSSLLTLLCAAASLAALDFALGLSLGARPTWLPASFGSDILDQFGARMAKVELLKRSGQIDEQNLVAVIGLSPAREGLDPQILAASDPQNRRWLILGAEGRTFATLEIYGRTLTDSAVRPSLVVLAISQAMLHHDDHAEPVLASPRLLPHHLRHLQLNHALLDTSWLYRNRDSLADEFTLLTYEAARCLRAALGLPMSATYAPEADPWSSWTAVFVPHADAAHMAAQWRGHQDLLVPDQFQSVDRQINALRQLVDRSRARGAEVDLVLMPETSRLRALEPPIVNERFAQALAAASDGTPLKVIDLRSAIPDELFWDDAHLNPQGRKQLSTLLPAILK